MLHCSLHFFFFLFSLSSDGVGTGRIGALDTTMSMGRGGGETYLHYEVRTWVSRVPICKGGLGRGLQNLYLDPDRYLTSPYLRKVASILDSGRDGMG
jgi:hypothetical protein